MNVNFATKYIHLSTSTRLWVEFQSPENSIFLTKLLKADRELSYVAIRLGLKFYYAIFSYRLSCYFYILITIAVYEYIHL